MTSEKSLHQAVLLNEILENLKAEDTRPMLFLDGTLGGGGHSEALLRQNSNFFLIGLDRDKEAVKRSEVRLKDFKKRMYLEVANFSEARDVLSRLPQAVREQLANFGIADSAFVDRALIDLGISSDQLDDPRRGFSFQADAPLDMRMSTDDQTTAADILNTYSEKELIRVFLRGGLKSNFSRTLAKAVLAKRPISRTSEFVALCEENRGSYYQDKQKKSSRHLATVPFQALRIEVNKEFDAINQFLNIAPDLLAPDARLAIISFHSSEDRLVTSRMRTWSRVDDVLKRLPISLNKQALGKLVTKSAIVPDAAEIKKNPRSRSARLRIFTRTNYLE